MSGHRLLLGDIVLGPPVVADGGQTLRQLAGRLRAAGVGSLLVLDEEGALAGIVTERDIVIALADGADPDVVWAADVMTTDPLCAELDDDAEVARELMLTAEVRHLPVVEGGRPIGVVSLRDVARGAELY